MQWWIEVFEAVLMLSERIVQPMAVPFKKLTWLPHGTLGNCK